MLQTETVLYNFGQTSTDAFEPSFAPLLLDASGNLYGMTSKGGIYGDGGGPLAGTVFKLTPSSSGWSEEILHSLGGSGDGLDGYNGLTMDAAGRIFGTTYRGGPANGGTVFEMVPSGTGWSESVIHTFPLDGTYPTDNLILDAGGNIYGSRSDNGSHVNGSIFEMSPAAGGAWHEKTLLNFGDITGPPGPLMLDGAGNLYSTTGRDGAYGYGTVFELSPQVGGTWTGKVLYNFRSSTDGNGGGALAMDPSGNIYGTTYLGGIFGEGALYELKPTTSGHWMEKVLYSFSAGCMDPDGNLILDSSGNLYGACYQGGPYYAGGIFKVSPGAGGTWTETTLHNFGGPDDGGYPIDGVTMDSAGNLYGMAVLGGTYGGGVAWEITP